MLGQRGRLLGLVDTQFDFVTLTESLTRCPNMVSQPDSGALVAEYDGADRIGAGGGLAHEGEDIEVFEARFDDALAMVDDGRIRDAKTIMLLQYAALHLFSATQKID